MLLADSVGLALQVVLDALAPAERLAFVLHDMFELPFEEIATMVGRSPAAARQLASRARRRVKGAEVPAPDPDLARQRAVVDAFFSAARGGDFDALLALLHPDVVLRADSGPSHPAASAVVHGAAAVARRARLGANPAAQIHPAMVNGAAGVVITMDGRPHAVMAFTVVEDKVVEIDVIADPERVGRVAASVLVDGALGGYRLGSDLGSPNQGSTLFSKRVMAQMRSPVRARTKRPTPWLMPSGERR